MKLDSQFKSQSRYVSAHKFSCIVSVDETWTNSIEVRRVRSKRKQAGSETNIKYRSRDGLFLSNLYGGHHGVILRRNKFKIDFALCGSRNVVEDLYNGPVAHSSGFFENVEILQ